MEIKFCGAAKEVTGSAHLITLKSGKTILLDCGLYQGHSKDMKDFNGTFPFDPVDIDIVILSHAHIDHSGRIPFLVKNGFKGNIYATHATTNLCSIMLLDSAHIQEADAHLINKRLSETTRFSEWTEPLYTREDVPPVMQRFISLPYNQWIPIDPEVTIVFRDAGHILGSANVTLKIREGGEEVMLGFSGDIGRPDRPILRDPRQMPQLDYLIMESTYGDKTHMSKPVENEKLRDIIYETCIVNKGKLIIPAFSIGRTQEIVYRMDQMANEGTLPRVPIFVDSPLAIDATEIYGSHPECYDEELTSYILKDPNPFGFKSLTYIREAEESKVLNTRREPCVIIAASGMMNAGRIRHHMYNHLENHKNTFLILGYCAPGTAGHLLLSGIEELKLFGDIKQVRAKIQKLDGFSAHADREEMLDFISNQKRLKGIFLVHGEEATQIRFKSVLEESGFSHVTIPPLFSVHQL